MKSDDIYPLKNVIFVLLFLNLEFVLQQDADAIEKLNESGDLRQILRRYKVNHFTLRSVIIIRGQCVFKKKKIIFILFLLLFCC